MAKKNKNVNETPESIVVLSDDMGNEVEFQVLDVIELDETDYVVLLPLEPDEETEGNVVILQVETIDDDSGEETFVGIDDEETINAVFEIFKKENLVKNSAEVGAYLKEKLEALAKENDAIKEVRGKGSMIGVELKDGNAAHVKHLLFENKYLVGATATTIRLLPPLIITKKDADDFVKIFEKVLKETE